MKVESRHTAPGPHGHDEARKIWSGRETLAADAQPLAKSEAMGDSGRPAYDRRELLLLLWHHPRSGKQVIRLNERRAAQALGWSRTTVWRALHELIEAGEVRRFYPLPRGGGKTGVLLVLTGPDPRQPAPSRRSVRAAAV